MKPFPGNARIGAAIVLFLAVLAVVTIPSARPLSASSQPDLTSGFQVIPNWAAADFDGDLRPDSATVRRGSSTPGGHWHHVSVTLSSGTRSTFSVASREALLHLFPRDVDDDGDADLVFVRPLTNEPIAVWLNEGSGRFHEGQLAEHRVGTFRTGGPGFAESPGRQPSAGHGSPTRSSIALSRTVTGVAIPPAIEPAFSCCRQVDFAPYSPPAGPRAPPLPTL